MNKQQADAVNDIWMKAYDHFRLRLNERYNLDISFKEYVLLTKERVEKIKMDNNKCIGWVMIRNVRVLVVKETKRNRLLTTALYHKTEFADKNDSQNTCAVEITTKEDFDYSEGQLQRLYEWLMDEHRQPAQTFFTAGWLRNVAREIESKFRQVTAPPL